MDAFEPALARFFEELGGRQAMVLATAAEGRVSARMMSVVILERRFYFQTDRTFRKYLQLCQNPNAALCAGNVQVEGTCRELGALGVCPAFCAAFERVFPNSYSRYTRLPGERLFVLEPAFLKRWIYEDGAPFQEEWDLRCRQYEKRPYRTV